MGNSNTTQKKSYIKTTRQEVSKHTNNPIWIIIDKHIYDITLYSSLHPGGKLILINQGGKDITKIFKCVRFITGAIV